MNIVEQLERTVQRYQTELLWLEADLQRADNMTDAMAALAALANCECAERAQALDAFYAKWKSEPLVVDKWLAVQAGSRLPGTLAEVRRLVPRILKEPSSTPAAAHARLKVNAAPASGSVADNAPTTVLID